MMRPRSDASRDSASSRVAAVRQLRRASVLVVGDAMLDRYVYGRVSRVSAEAPVPILAIERETAVPGGAANVVRNLTALGAASAFVSVVGDDQPGADLTGLVGGQPGVEPWLLVQGGRATTTKTRFVAAGQQILRADREQASPIHPRLADRLVRIASDALAATRAIVLSDYHKAVLAADVAPRLIELARKSGRKVVVQPRAGELERFEGADLVVLESDRALAAPGTPPPEASASADAALELLRRHRFGAVLVVRGSQGLTLVTGAEAPRHWRADASDQDDPAGAGEAVVAVMAAALAVGQPLALAAELAAAAIGIVSRKVGIAVVREDELAEAFTPGFRARQKLVSLPFASAIAERWRHRGWRIGLLHLAAGGAARWTPALLEQARSWCDRLIICICDDAATVLADSPLVDLVAHCEGQSNEALLRLFRPDVLVHGPDAVPLGHDDENLLSEWGGALHRPDLATAAE
ncbi:MAG: PfkB family carbohydrate kinase [Rhodovarius sp.]|nr:PfkB family carbohydrate kinase [Rhodovarius sp.]